MDMQELSVKTRENTGKGSARRARMVDTIPGILYGEGKENVNLLLDKRAFEILLQGKQGEHAVLNLTVEDNPGLSGPVMIKDVQHHPVSGYVLHTDFMHISLDKKIHTSVPIKLEGRSVGIIEGGVLDNQMRDLEIECLPTEVPEFVTGDIAALDIGHSIHVKDLVVPGNITVLTEPSRTVAAVHAPRVIVEETEEEAVEGDEAAAVEGEEGEETEEKSD